MKKFFSFTFAIFMLISMVGLVGCNGLWDFDDDDDVTQVPVKFAFKGAVALGGPLAPGPVLSIRGALSAASYVGAIVNVYAESDKAGTNDLSDGSITVDATGAFNVDFTALNGTAFYIKISKTGLPTLYRFFGAKTSTEMENDYRTTAAEVNEKTTAVGIMLIQNPDLKYDTDITEADTAIYDNTAGTGLAKDFFDFFTDPTVVGTPDPDNFNPAVPATAVAITNADPVGLIIGAEVELAATVSPAYTTDTISWAVTSGAGFVSLTGTTLKATAAGTAVVTVTAGTKTDTITINVTAANVAVTGVTLNKTTTSIAAGSSETLIATVAPATASNKTVTWKSSDDTVATVDTTGNVTGQKAGTATITVTTADGSKTATCAVTVTAAATTTSVTLSSSVTTGTTTGMQIVLTGMTVAQETALESNTTLKVTLPAGGTNYDFTVDKTISELVPGVKVIMKVNTTNLATFDSFNSLTFSEVLPTGTAVSVTQGGTEVATGQ